MPSPGCLDSILLLARSCLSCRFNTAGSSSFPCSRPTFSSSISLHILGTYCFKGHPFPYTSKLALPMVVCQALHNLHTSQLSPLAPTPPIPSRISPPVLLSLLLSLLPHANLSSISTHLSTTSLRDIFCPCDYFPHTHHTFSSLPSLHTALLPSLATPLCLDSPIGCAQPPHIPST